MGERMDTKTVNAFPDRLKTAWNHGYSDGFHGRPSDSESVKRSGREPLLEEVYTHGHEAGKNDASDGAEWTGEENERPELSQQEFFDLLNGKIAGLILSMKLIMDMSMKKDSLSPVKNALSDTAKFIKDEKDDGFYSHMPEEYISGTLHVLKKLAEQGKGK